MQRPRLIGNALVAVALAVGGLLLVSGCSSSPNGVSVAAEGFYSALADSDGTAACALLSAATRTELEQSAGTTCPEAVLEEDLPEPDGEESTKAYGTMAIVTSAGDTMFLSRFPQGWLVTAVGCRLTGQADRYDCSLAGS